MKVLIPPFIGFSMFFIAVRYSPYYFDLKIDEMGEGNLQSFMAYYRYCLPLLFVVGILTQYLFIVPLWNTLMSSSVSARIISFLLLCLICLLFAVGIGYAIWERRSGVHHLFRVCLFLTGVQITYWIINILTLLLLSEKPGQLIEREKVETAE